MTFNTGNPIGSTDARDLSDNAENFDKALNSTAETWTDRLGVTRDTFEGALSKLSFYRVGTFAAGYTLTNMRQTLEYNGHEYSWAGTFPKVVAAGATPATSGGIGAGAWVDRTDLTLRSTLINSDGASHINYQIDLLASIRSVLSKLKELPSLDDYLFTTWEAAVVLMSAQIGFVRFARGEYTFVDDITIDVPVHFEAGAYLTISSGKTVTFSSRVTSPRQWIFRGDGLVSFAHDSDSGEDSRQAHISWFGAFPRSYNASNPDQAPFIQKAMNAFGNARESHLIFDIGNYMMRSSVTCTRGAAIVGHGTRRTVFLHDTDGFETFVTAGVAVKFQGIQFEVYEPTLPAKTSPFIGVQHGECEIYDVDVSNNNCAIYTTANNTRIKNIRAAYGSMQGSNTATINIRGGNGHVVDGVYLGTSQYAPESAVLIGGPNQVSAISGSRINNISHIAPCASFKIDAQTNNITQINVDGFEYSGSTDTKPLYQVTVKASGSASVSAINIEGGQIGANSQNGMLIQNDSTGVMSNITIDSIVDRGTTGIGINFVENSGTLIGASVGDAVRVNTRATPFAFTGQGDDIVISPNALTNTNPAYCYDFTVADDAVSVINLQRSIYSAALIITVATADYATLVIRAAPTPASTVINSTANIATAITPLTGTTGTDGKFTIGVTDKNLYFENRLGSSKKITVSLLSGH